MTYKLKFWTEDDEGEHWDDLYLNVSSITGFYIPKKDVYDKDLGINLFFNGGHITVKQEKHIMDYLTLKFVSKSIE